MSDTTTITAEMPGAVYMAASGTLITMGESDVRNFSDVQQKDQRSTTPWAPWTRHGGAENQFPREMAEKIRQCGVLSAGIEAKARIAIGKGIRPVLVTGIDNKGEEIYEFVNDPEIDDWMEQNNIFKHSIQTIRNIIGYGWSEGRFILDNNGDKIMRYKTDDVAKLRLERKSATTGKIEHVYYAADWKTIKPGDDEKFLKKIPLLEEDNEFDDLEERLKPIEGEPTALREFAIISRGPLNGHEYYPLPLWYSCWDWVEMTIKVPEMKVAMMNNQASIKYIITISPSYFSRGDSRWDSYTAEEKQEKFRAKATEINNHLVGNANAYKSIVSGSYIDPASLKEINDIRIEVLDDKIKDGKLLPDSGAANKEILFALMINPAIMGANTFGGDYSGGAGSGSDIREAYLVQIMLMESERQMNANLFDVVKRWNKWTDRYKGKVLKFRYPSLILTTLDTGGSTVTKPQ